MKKKKKKKSYISEFHVANRQGIHRLVHRDVEYGDCTSAEELDPLSYVLSKILNCI